jgi:hypothetical protein
MTREWAFFVQDIYDAIQHIKEFVGTMKQKEFLADEKTRSAVAFKIENIGEASKNIPRQVKAKYKKPSLDRNGKDERQDHSFLFWNQLPGCLVCCKKGVTCPGTRNRKDLERSGSFW